MLRPSRNSPRARTRAGNESGSGLNWGKTPWKIAFHSASRRIPQELDFAIVGGGFTGLAAAAWLRRLAPRARVALFEAGSVGAGLSGRTGGIAPAENTACDPPGPGHV